jgi:hypothetical protein
LPNASEFFRRVLGLPEARVHALWVLRVIELKRRARLATNFVHVLHSLSLFEGRN